MSHMLHQALTQSQQSDYFLEMEAKFRSMWSLLHRKTHTHTHTLSLSLCPLSACLSSSLEASSQAAQRLYSGLTLPNLNLSPSTVDRHRSVKAALRSASRWLTFFWGAPESL